MASPERFVLSGCSGGGKTTLLQALAVRGLATVSEPGRRIVQAGGPMPRDDPLGFARQAVRIACADLAAAPEGVVFFDRGLVDAVAAVAHLTGTLPPEAEGLNARYAQTVFLVPPWPEIYGQDAARRHAFTAAAAEYERLRAFYPRFGYRPVILPRVPVAARVALVLDRLGL